MMYTLVAVAIAVVVIAGAFVLTSQPKARQQPLGSPNAPVGSAITPVSIPANGFVLGNADAKHTIDIYEDFQCPVCRDFTVDVEPQIVANYVATGKAKLVWHDFVVNDANLGGTESLDAANAARCASDQGKFWPYHDWLYANQYPEAVGGSGAFTKDRLKTIGMLVGIADLTRFNSCVDSGTHDAEVRAESHPSDATGTPSVYVDGGSVLPGYSYSVIAQALDKALGVTPSPSAGASASASAAPSATPAPSASPS
jgi:protein-disulfide isomerase